MSWENIDRDGKTTFPFGEHPVGYLLYQADGLMSVTMMRDFRPHFESPDILRGSNAEKSSAYETFLAYAGRYTIGDGIVMHHIEVCSFPNWVSTEQEREMVFAGDHLILSGSAMELDGSEQIARLRWIRCSHQPESFDE